VGIGVHNAPRSLDAKLEIRKNVLEFVEPARVFDGFCGPVGEMWSRAWRAADDYVGCDQEWILSDQRKRFVGDVRDVLRAVDLQRWNVFDFDAFGSPWDAMVILAERRRWSPGEIGAVVITDGASMKSKFGQLPKSVANLIGRAEIASGQDNAFSAHDDAMRAWMRRCCLVPAHSWRARGKPNRRGVQMMNYQAVVFRARCGRVQRSVE